MKIGIKKSGWLRRRGFLASAAVGGALLPRSVRAADAEWNSLKRRVVSTQEMLLRHIRSARQKDIVTDYAEVSYQVIGLYLIAAQHDHDHMDRVRKIFKGYWPFPKIDPVHTERLPVTELEACLELADHAMEDLRKQTSRQVTRTAPPDLIQGRMKLEGAHYELDGRIVFPSSLVWTPREEFQLNCFGRLGGGYLQLTHMGKDGSPNRHHMEKSLKSLAGQRELNMQPAVFLTGHNAPGWLREQHPEVVHGGRNFVQYDIDSPAVREWMNKLYQAYLPEFGKACGDMPMMHLLANEPHFATRRGGWLAKNGLSDHTLNKFHGWLEKKYGTIASLNAVYAKTYAGWEEVLFQDTPPLGRQVDPRLRGGPVWYDWVRFNMDRVNEWFTFLKEEAQAADGGRQAPVSIKVLGFSLSKSDRDGGMDMEYLTRLQDVMGADLRCAPAGAQFFRPHEEGMEPETGWQVHYAYDWSEQIMFLDFSKSICPDKPFYDSEWHGFGTVSWRHFSLSRGYVRSAIWMAFTHGMSAINPWLWGRGEDGAFRGSTDHIGELATQPIAVDAYSRTMKELNAFAPQVASLTRRERQIMIYYCEEAAIQDPTYTAGFKAVYEALKLLNYPVGFATPSEIRTLSIERQTVIVSPTAFILDNSWELLQAFRQAGGRVVLVGGEESFLKDEMGRERSGGIVEPAASLETGHARQLVGILREGLPVKPDLPVDIRITDAGGRDTVGVIIDWGKDPETGRILLALNNVSKDKRVVTLSGHNDRNLKLADVIDHRHEKRRIVLEPCDVRLLIGAV